MAFLRAADGPAQVWLLPADGGEPEQLTSLPLGAGAPVWSPDGARIAFAAATDRQAPAGEDDAARSRRASAPIVADRLDYRADGAGHLRGLRKHLHVVDLATRACRQVTDGDWHAGDPAWSPDSAALAFSAATAADADLVLRAPVYVVDVNDGAAPPRLVGLADGIGGPLTWTADGSALLVVGHPGDPVGHAGLLRVPVTDRTDRSDRNDGDIANLAAPLDRNVMPGGPAYPGAVPQLVDGGGTVLFCARDRGCTSLYAVPVEGGWPRPVIAGAGRNVAGLSVAGGVAALVLATPTSFGEIVTVDLGTGAETVRTEHGAALAEVELFARQEREFTVSDGTVVSGWLIRDPAVSGPGPLLLDIHGGPHNAWNGAADDVHLYHQELVARGWAVLLLNPRGSDGYGERFYNAALGGWGEQDARDFLEPIDALVAEGIADPRRLAVTGYSYGGYMTCYLTSRDHRFAAAVAGGVVTDLTSMAGTSDAGHFLGEHEFGAASWARPDRYAAMSPLSHVDDVRTPTLILHGAADLRCPVGQAEQWHTALRAAWRADQAGALPGGRRTCSSWRVRRRTGSTTTAGSSTGSQRYAADPTGPRPAPDRRRALAAAARRAGAAAPGAGRRARHPARRPTGRPDELVEAAHGVLNVDTGVVDHHRLGVPDRVDLQGLDRDAGDAARRRGQARPRRADRERAARAAAGRRRRDQARDHAPPAHPHQRHRRRRLHRHRAGRRLPRALRGAAGRRGAEPSRSAPPGRTATPGSRWPVWSSSG